VRSVPADADDAALRLAAGDALFLFGSEAALRTAAEDLA